MVVFFSSPCGNRTRLASVRGWHPKPIDERAMLSVRRAGVEPANPQGMAGLRPVGLTNAQSSRVLQVARAGVEPAHHEGLSFAALPVCVPRHSSSALDGIWTRDLLRDRQASTPGCSTRACVFLQWLRWESNPTSIPTQPLAAILVATIANAAALQMRCKRAALIVLPWHPLTPICNGSSEHGMACRRT